MIVDISGWFESSSSNGFVEATPNRLVDTGSPRNHPNRSLGGRISCSLYTEGHEMDRLNPTTVSSASAIGVQRQCVKRKHHGVWSAAVAIVALAMS